MVCQLDKLICTWEFAPCLHSWLVFTMFQHIWECFGEDRVMFGSDWPVCRLVNFEHSDVVKLYREVLTACGASQRQLQKYFYQNTCNFYGLQV